MERSEQSEGGTLVFHFESDSGGSVFNPDALALMRDIDELVMSVPGYEDYCQLKYDPVTEEVLGCATRVSPVSYFFPSVDPNLQNATTYDGRGDLVDDVDAVVRMFSEDRRAFGYFLDGDFDAAGGVNRVTRVKYPMGAPRAGYVAVDDREDDQRAEIGEGWLDAVEASLFRRFAMKARFLSTPYMGLVNENGTDVRFYAGYLRSKDSQRIIGYDLSWAGASILAVWVYMTAHTGSAFIATLGMFEILASFPVSIFLYRVLFRVSYLGNIQILSVFVVLGVGADDVFVFFDAFKQSAYEHTAVAGTTLTRVTYAAKRASKGDFRHLPHHRRRVRRNRVVRRDAHRRVRGALGDHDLRAFRTERPVLPARAGDLRPLVNEPAKRRGAPREGWARGMSRARLRVFFRRTRRTRRDARRDTRCQKRSVDVVRFGIVRRRRGGRPGRGN